MKLTANVRRAADLRRELQSHEEAAKARSMDLRQQIVAVQREIELDSAQLDFGKIEAAYKVLFVRGTYAKAGDERAGVIADAVHQIATGEMRGYRGLDHENFGTKSYDRWHGQRCDCEPGFGPRHGSIIFQIGLTKEAKERGGIEALTDDEREAAVYLLTRLEAVQTAEAKAAAA